MKQGVLAMAASTSIRPGTRRLLQAGVVAGPLFVLLVLVQLATTPAFDLARHPISLLSLAERGWLQIGAFVVSGLLSVGFAAGVSRSIEGRGATWGPRLLALYGLGLIAGGVFVADPGLGFPPGTPEGIPSEFSWHGILHAFAPPAAMTALVGAAIVFTRRFRAAGERDWATYSALTAIVILAMAASMGAEGMSVRLALATLLGWVWLTAFALHLVRAGSAQPAASRGRGEDSVRPHRAATAGEQPPSEQASVSIPTSR